MVRLPRIFPKVEVSFEYTHMWDGKSKKKKKKGHEKTTQRGSF